MTEKILINLNGAVILELEKNVSLFFDYCEKQAPKDDWENLTLEKLEEAFKQVQDDLLTHQKGKRRWEHILQISRFNPSEIEEAYERMEFYEQRITEITHTLHIFGMLMDIIKLNHVHGNDIDLRWLIIEE